MKVHVIATVDRKLEEGSPGFDGNKSKNVYPMLVPAIMCGQG